MKIDKIIQDKLITSSTKVDFYVPITVEFNTGLLQSKIFYYRYLSNNSSFIEFTIDSLSKQIMRVIVITINEINDIKDINYNIISSQKKLGIPLVSLPEGNINIYTENIDFTFYKYNKSIVVVIKNTDVVTRLYMDGIEFLLDNNSELIGIVFNNLDNDNWITLTEVINKSL